MTAYAIHYEYKHIVIDLVDQKPIRFNVALAATLVFTP